MFLKMWLWLENFNDYNWVSVSLKCPALQIDSEGGWLCFGCISGDKTGEVEHGNADTGHLVVEVLVYMVMILEVKWTWEELGDCRGSRASHCWFPFLHLGGKSPVWFGLL